MTHEELMAVRAANKRNRILHQLGIPVNTTAEETAKLLAYVRWLHQHHGMSSAQIADAAGVHAGSIQTYVKGYRTASGGRYPVKGVYRSTYEKIMAVRPEPIAVCGATISPIGGRRRLQALCADGFSYNYLAEHLTGGEKGNGHIWKMTNGGTKGMSASKRDDIAALYDKLEGVRPQDEGLGVIAVQRAVSAARARGYAPRSCWDPDTIDSPDAIPEWTGACGTLHGPHLHRKYGILPVCAPCKAAHLARRRETRGEKKRG
jgi:hypothetical protein